VPYTTIVAGTTIAASWANANVRDQVITPFANTSARDSSIGSPVEGMCCYITGSDVLQVYNGANWVTITPQSATVATSQNTATTSFTDLGTVGPAVTLDTGTKALITLTGQLSQNNASGIAAMGFAVSGASTIAAADPNSVWCFLASTTAAASMTMTFAITSLTGGSNTFTAKYKAGTAGTATFKDRSITVVGLP